MENNNRKKSYSKQIGNDCPAGLVPPHDVKLEQAVLGAMLLESDLYAELAGILTADTFYDPRHSALFAAIRSVATAGRPVDLFTVSSALRETKSLDAAGGIAYVTECSTRVGSGAHALYHAQILRQLFIMRTMIVELNALSGKCYDGDFDGMMSEYAATTGRIDSLFAGSGAEKHIRDIVKRHGQVVDDRIVRANQGGIQGITYGLSRLDRVTNGARPDQLIIVAARPAMGKTALALKFAMSAAKDNRHVTIANLEMSDISLTDRLVSTYAGVDSQRLKSGRMDARDLKAYQQAVRDLERLEISIYDTPNTTFGRLAAMARTKHRKGRLDHYRLLAVDRNRYRRQELPQQPRAGSGRYFARTEIAGDRTENPDHSAVPTEPRCGKPRRQATATVRPARIGRYRTGRRPGADAVPPGVLQGLRSRVLRRQRPTDAGRPGPALYPQAPRRRDRGSAVPLYSRPVDYRGLREDPGQR